MTKDLKEFYKCLYDKAMTGAYGHGSQRERFFKSIGLTFSDVKAVATDQGKSKSKK